MNASIGLRFAARAAFLASAMFGGLQAAEKTATPPNIVFILLDNVGREWFDCYGSEEHCTPNIDRLAQSGVRFTNCYTTVVCGPSRVELLTGRYPHHTGWHLHHDAALYGGGGLDPKREVTIARLLRDRGFATGISGKWQVNNLYDEPDVLAQHGFQEQLVWPGSIDRDRVDETFIKSFQQAIGQRDAAFLTEATSKIESRYWDPVMLRNGRRERLTGRFGPDVFAEFALDFVRRHRAHPFFLYYPMVLTHGQNATQPTVLTPANRDAAPKDEKAAFAGMLRYADRQVGAFVNELAALGLRDNTIVFIASDNGTEKSITARAHGRSVPGGLYQINEAGGNVALMANCPAHIAGGRTAALADFTDILPTICDLTQCPSPAGVKIDGQSFASFLTGGGTAPRKWIFNEYGPDRVVRDERYKLNQRGELFDLDADPDEKLALATPDPDASAAKVRLQAVLDSMPSVTPLPFEHRSLSAFKLRAQDATANARSWRTLPLISDGRIDSAWAQVGWGGFVVDDGTLRAEPDDRGMGLLLYKPEKFGDCQLRVVYRCEKPKSNSGIYVRLDDGVIARIGEKSPEVHRDEKGKLSKDMLRLIEVASEKHLGAWYPVHHGYEVQIMDASDAFHRTGAIYSLAKAGALPAKSQSEWHTMIITLNGERISVEIDGKPVSSFDASASDLPPRQKWSEPIRDIRRPTHGYIGLQNHDPGDVVWFKEVSVRPLDGQPENEKAVDKKAGASTAPDTPTRTSDWPGEKWPEAEPAALGLDLAKLAQGRDHPLTAAGSGCIIYQGKLVMRWGDPATLYDLKSSSKAIGVTLLGVAMKDGKVTLNESAKKFHPQFGVPPKENVQTGWLDKITLRMLADQTAGFEKPGGFQPLLFEPGTHYSMLWWNNIDGTIPRFPRDACRSWGLYDSLIVVVPSLDRVIARAGKSWRREKGADHYDVLTPFLKPIAAAITTKAGAAVCPPSPVIAGINWAPPENIVRRANGSDNWPMTWADDAHEPWGPWTPAFQTKPWDVGPGESNSLPTKWMSADGRSVHPVFSGDDHFCVRQGTIVLRDTPKL